MLNRFTGVNIYADDPGEIIDFYHNKLGIPILDEGYGEYDGAQLGFIKGAPVIYIWNKRKWEELGQGTVNLVFTCTSLDEVYHQLKAKNMTLEPPFKAAWGGRELTLADPMGNPLTLLEETEL